ncbi:universal stress protein (plasmid) [Haloferax mediterranei ATCC 33500]|uniref:Universal stress protein n=1 Tax=Haloferax mediterranei (strain ATCC 33500 / DSM 1411 / JCM 8866 / NBRC 14739 / NCIMB 2177 / R-4) TaxID=523841 RepID=I3RBE0_HALMT|nr:universal stress protein [Haloferax mediterranei]AFK21550.1 universal stress protein [Haloferax mediterranei ATCC 33500]AHZ24400.1 universal stress protein UspA [Haloferax mediterranei ATCC 33500]ELZ97141.1 universal stress protein [Haloferax mediterranei ATCC 33500]MDX5990116.1 universal stress protein [Haloferax mediterranei ATCC 33500]QCQ76800.1 universal stress protein [Haloferax mediterranei ATCC 33500]
MGTILLATDGSEYARQAAKRAIEFAEEQGETLHVICVVDQRRFDSPALSSAELATIYAEDNAALCVKEVAEMAEGSNVRVEGDSKHGIPHEVILDYADEVDADVIFIGEHGDHKGHFSGVGRKVLKESEEEVRVVGVES